MSKPASVVSWATTGGTRLDPTAPEKAAGFANGQRVPARWLNQLFGLLGDWTTYLNGLAGEVFTWTAAHAFTSTVTVTNDLVYAAPVTRKISINASEELIANVASSSWTIDYITGLGSGWKLTSGVSGDDLIGCVRLPAGCIVTAIRFKGSSTSGASSPAFIASKVTPNMGIGFDTAAALGSSVLLNSGTPNVGSIVTANGTIAQGDVIHFEVQVGTVGCNGNIAWIEVTYTETIATGHV